MLQYLGDHGSVLGHEIIKGLVVDIDLGIRLEFDPEGSGGIGGAAAHPGAPHARHHNISFFVALLDLGDGPHRGVLPSYPGHQDQATAGLLGGRQGDLSFQGLDAEGDHHMGEDHAVS